MDVNHAAGGSVMKMNVMRFLTCVALAATTLTSTSSAQAVRTASVALRRPVFAAQQASQWCWAASVSNLFAYYGHDVSQARIVAEVYGTVANMRSGDYSNLSRLLNRSWQAESGERFSSRLVAALDIANGVSAINNDAIRDALDDDRPLVIGTTNHAMLVTGMRYTERGGHVAQVVSVDLFDPWPGAGHRQARPEEVTPVTLGGALMFIADAQISSDGARAGVRPIGPLTPAPATALGRSCQTQIVRCGPFFNQPAMPVGSSCYCATPYGPAPGVVVR